MSQSVMSQSIVIVDDDPDAREILELILGTLEIPIRQARNGFEALELITEDPPALIVLDLAMPYLDGQAVLQELRGDPATANIPVIIFTAGEVTPEKAAALQVPLCRMIRKGGQSMTSLRNVVVEALGAAIEVDLSFL